MSTTTSSQQRPDSISHRERPVTARLKCLFGFRSTDYKKRKTQSIEDPFRQCGRSSRIDVQVPEVPGCSDVKCKSGNPPVSPVKLSVRNDPNTLESRQELHSVFQARLASDTLRRVIADYPPTKSSRKFRACHAVLGIPEILECILSQLEPRPSDSTLMALDKPLPGCLGPLSSCLMVNFAFATAAKRLMSRRVSIDNIESLRKYLEADASRDNMCRDLLIHRVKICEQPQFQLIAQTRLRSLELYVCPKLIPSEEMLSHGTLRKIALPGCALVDDRLIQSIALKCPLLQILDLRACELVSDEGILKVAQYCSRLSYLNVGRVNGSHAITDRSIVDVCTNTSIETLGLAGCAITDETVFAIARLRGTQIERLSMNQCHQVTDRSICELLRSCPRLQVLEIVGCDRTRDAKSLCYFKISTGALVETSEVFALEMQLHEREIRYELERLKKRVLKSPRRVTN